MVRAPLVIALAAIGLGGCSKQPAEDNLADASQRARLRLLEQRVEDIDNRLSNVEDEQTQLNANVQELTATASTHDEQLQTLETHSRQTEADVEAVKGRLNM